MDIKEIALKVADSLRNKVDGISHMQSNQGLVRFAEALIESYKAELLKEVDEPVGIFWYEIEDDWRQHEWGISVRTGAKIENGDKLFTSDQVAAAILKATKPLEDQLAKAEQLWQVAQGRCDGLEEKLAKVEQRVAEACALYIHSTKGAVGSINMAEAVLSGKWRKFVKEM